MMGRTVLAAGVVAAIIACIPAAMADPAEIEMLYEQLEAIELKYGFSGTPDLTQQQWDQYYTETEPLHQKAAEYHGELDGMYAEYDRIVERIAEIDERGPAIDSKYGISPFPYLTQDQWDAYDAETQVVWQEMDDYWAEYDRRVAETPGLEFQQDIDALYDKLAVIDTKYGFAQQPELTADQWEGYFTEWDELETLKAPLYQELDSVPDAYQGTLDKIEEIGAQMAAIDAEYGISNVMPSLTPQELRSYDEERAPILERLESFGLGESAMAGPQHGGVDPTPAFAASGITMPGPTDENYEAFMAAFANLQAKYPAFYAIGDPMISDADKESAYSTLAGASQEIRGVFEGFGYAFGPSTAQEFRELDMRVMELASGG